MVDDVDRVEFLRRVLDAWRAVPDDWSFGRLVANASHIAHGGDVPLRTVEDGRLISGFVALVPDPFEDDPSIIVDPYARAWERENLAFVEEGK